MKIKITSEQRKTLMGKGWRRQTISNWVSGRANPSRAAQGDIEEALGKKVRWPPYHLSNSIVIPGAHR